MDTERRILRSTTVLFAAQLASQAANFLFVVLLARAHSPGIFGEYSFALSLGSILALFVSLGTNGLLLRSCSRDPGLWRGSAGIVLPVQVVMLVVTWTAVLLASMLFNADDTSIRIIVSIVLFQLLNPIATLFTIGFTATERMGYSAIADAGSRILILGAGSTAIWLNSSIESVVLVFPISALAVLAVLMRLAHREFGRPQILLAVPAARRLLAEAMPFFGIVALTVIYGRLGVLILRTMSGAAEVGNFAAAERLVMAACILHSTFAQAIYPPMVRLFRHSRDMFDQLKNRSLRLILLVTLPLATTLYLFAEDLIALLFGTQYDDASQVLRIMAWVIALRGLTVVANQVGLASDRQRLVLISNLAGIVALTTVAVALVPERGAIGIAIATFTAQCVKLIAICLLLRPSGLLPDFARIAPPVAVACGLTILLNNWLPEFAATVRLAVVAVTGAILLYLLRAIRAQDFAYAYRILSTRARPAESGSDG